LLDEEEVVGANSVDEGDEHRIVTATGTRKLIDAIEDEWNALSDEGPCSAVFQRPAGVRAFLEAYWADGQLVMFQIRNSRNALRGLLVSTIEQQGLGPVRLKVLRGASTLESGGIELIHGDGDRQPVVRALVSFLEKWDVWDAMHCVSFPAKGALAEVIEHLGDSGHPVGKVWDLYDWYVPQLPAGVRMEEAIESLPKSLRSELRRSLRRLHDKDKHQWASIGPECGKEEVRKSFFEFLELEKAGWKGREGVATCLHPNLQRYHESFVDLERMVVHKLEIGGQPAAMCFGYIDGQRFYGIRTTYDERFKRLAPGLLLAVFAMKDVANRGCEVFHLGESGNDPRSYKRAWTDSCHPVSSRVLFRRSFSGRIVFTLAFRVLPGIARRFPTLNAVRSFASLDAGGINTTREAGQRA
jgi:hypothetical protein